MEIEAREVRLTPSQSRFFLNEAKIKGLFGGRGSGKTTVGCLECLKNIEEQPGLNGAIIAPDHKMLLRSTLPEFLEWIPSGGIVDQNKSESWLLFRNGSKVYYSGIDDPDSWRGPNLAWAWFDESARKKTIDAWLVILGCVRIGKARLFTTSTPRGKTHWLHDVFVKNPIDGVHWHGFASSEENEKNLDPQFIPTLKASYIGAWAQQELYGRFVELEGTIFRRQDFKIIDQAPEGLRWVRFWDLAVSVKTVADYTAGAKVAFKDGKVYIADMIRGRWEYPEAKEMIVQTAQVDGSGVWIGVERVAFQLAAIQELQRIAALAAHYIEGVVPDKDKLSRAMGWAARARSGNVLLVNGPWVHDFLNEADDFPQGTYLDQIDAVSGAVQMLARTEGPFIVAI